MFVTVTVAAVVVFALVGGLWLVRWRPARSRPAPSFADGADVEPIETPTPAEVVLTQRPQFPPSGLLVSEAVLTSVQSAGSVEAGSAAIWEALEGAAVPIGLEYYPVGQAEISKYRTVPINAVAQKTMVDVVEALRPGTPTLYRVVLPKGAELVRAVGTSGFRGFSRSGGKTAHAVLKPVAAGGAVAIGWPALAVAGTVMAIDMAAQRELRAHQQRVDAILQRQERRHYRDRIAVQRSAEAQVTRVVSLMLDGRNPDMELALKSSIDEFHRAQEFLQTSRDAIQGLVQPDGKIDYRQLEKAIGDEKNDFDFFWELQMAQGAIAIRRKALVADAAAVALADPGNPYNALRRFLDAEVNQLEQAEANAAEITERLTSLELKGGWSIPKAVKKRERLRALAAPSATDEGSDELLFLATADGDLVQVISTGEDTGADSLRSADEGPDVVQPIDSGDQPPVI